MARLPGLGFVALTFCTLFSTLPDSALTRAEDQRGDKRPQVTLPQGELAGQWLLREGGSKPYAAFRGIPYAAPPVGELRFKGPKPPPSWKGVRDADKEGSKCPHLTVPAAQMVGEEDCLFLNVYTPAVPGYHQAFLLPVMVYIHGGGFMYGSGTKEENGPDFLLEHGVVVVTLNYRLGALGFLSLDTEGLPGNAGLKDQRAALVWIRDNIAFFGGDPKLVTLFGNSAGAASSHYHSIVPASKGLFGAAILQSGNALGSWAYTEAHRERAARLATLLGAANSSDVEVERVVRAATKDQILNATIAMILADPVLQVGYPAFPPTPERRERGAEEVFLPQDPESLVLDPVVEPVPMIIGANTDEGLFAYYFGGLVNKPELVAFLSQDPRLLLPINIPPAKDTAALLKVPYTGVLNDQNATSIAGRVKAEYFPDNDTLTNMIKLLGDVFTVHTTHRLATLSKPSPDAPMYIYHFGVEDEYNWGKKLFNMTLPGVSHTDELGYLMHITNPDLKQDLHSGSLSSQTLWLLTSMWTNFAKYRNPLPTQQIWPPTHLYGIPIPVLVVGKELEVCNGFGGEKMRIWDEIYNSQRRPAQ